MTLKHAFGKSLFMLRLEFLILVLSKRGYLYKSGWLKSYAKRKPVNLKNESIPWFSYASIDFLKERLNKNLTVFEYGSGGSTMWFAERTKAVYSVESDKKWYELIKDKIPENVHYFFEPIQPMPYVQSVLLPLGKGFDNYNNKIGSFSNLFDVVIVDGVDRINSIKSGIPRLASGGVMIVDNCEYEEIQKVGLELLKKAGFKRLSFSGISPGTTMETITSIFYKSDNCLGI